MSPSGIEFLEHCRSVYQGKIDRFLCPECERAFREYAAAITAPQFGERVMQSRNSEHAERFTDMLLDFENERNRRVEEYQKLIARIDEVLEGQAGEFLTGSAALKWVRLAEAGHRQKDIAQAVGMSEARISQITKNKNLNNLSENPIKTSSAAEEKKEGLLLNNKPIPWDREEMARLPKENRGVVNK